MGRKTGLVLSSLLFSFFQSCNHAASAFNTSKYTPENPYSAWVPLKGSAVVTSRYCEALIPPSFADGAELSLAELIDIGLQNNPNTKITWAEARSAAAGYGQTLAAYYPELVGASTYMRERQTFVFGTSPQQEFASAQPFYLTTITPELTLTYIIFDFGQRRNTSETARQALFEADWVHNFEIQAVIQTIMNNYYNYLYQKELLSAKVADLDNACMSLDASEEKFKYGVANLNDVAQAKSNYFQAKISFISQQKEVENSFALLATQIGLPANIPFSVQGLPSKICMEPILDDIQHLLEKAQNYRADLHAAEANVRSKEAGVRVAELASWPKVNGLFDFGKNWYSGGFTEDYHFTAAVSLNFPLFKGFYFQNGIKIAKAQLEESKATLLDVELNIIKDVTTFYQNFKTAIDTMKFSEDYVEAAKIEFDSAIQNYKAGTTTILTVLSAQSSLANARSQLASSKKDWYTSLAGLAYATGSLCPVNEEGPCID